MPFGVCGGPEAFSSVINEIKKDLGKAFLAFLDDIILCSNSMEEHLRDIDYFLEVMIKNNLKLRMDKCQWARKEIKYLGYVISKDSIRPDPKKIEAIKNIKPPTTYKQLLGVHGALSYHRYFIVNL
uniref:Reverse transcriptase domain-containing protein n=1 Tax=Acrobeloides nanus TaxID=290746 RepID=A0A914E6X7_9BILA